MTDQHAVYTPPAGYPILTPLYDIGVRLSTREKRWRRDLVDLIEPKCNEVLLDIGAGTLPSNPSPCGWPQVQTVSAGRMVDALETGTNSRVR